MGILFGLAAALCIGISDFLARSATRRVGTYHTLFYVQLIGFFVISFFLLTTGTWRQINFVRDWQAWGWATIAALLDTGSYFALYRAFETGLIMVVSPIVSGYAAITLVLSVLSGEKFTPYSLSGLGAILIGIMLAQIVLEPRTMKKQTGSRESVEPHSSPSQKIPTWMWWTLGACVGFGVIYWLLGFAVVPVLGGIASSWLFRLIPLCLLTPASALTHRSLLIPRSSVWIILIAISLLDTTGIIFTVLGLATGQVAVVSTLSSLYSITTLALAWVFLKEQLRWNQWIGIILILGGIILISA